MLNIVCNITINNIYILVSASLRSVPLESLESRGRRVHGGDMTHVMHRAGTKTKNIVF